MSNNIYSKNHEKAQEEIAKGHSNGVPTSLTPVWSNIPKEMGGSTRQWVVWQYETAERKNGKEPTKPYTKVPYNPRNLHKASTTWPNSWHTLITARSKWEEQSWQGKKGTLQGVGYVLQNDEVGIDLDACRDSDTGGIDPWAQEVISRFTSYSEISPSGKGIRIFCKGRVPKGKNKKGSVELYDKNSPRYLTVTGHWIDGTPTVQQWRQDEIDWLFQKYLADEKPDHSKSDKGGGTGSHYEIVDPDQVMPEGIALADLLSVATQAANGEKFDTLWNGNWDKLYSSESEADLALCAMLAFYVGHDSERLEDIFRLSPHYDNKDEDHLTKWDRPDYSEGTLATAIDNLEEVYNWEAYLCQRSKAKEYEAGEKATALIQANQPPAVNPPQPPAVDPKTKTDEWPPLQSLDAMPVPDFPVEALAVAPVFKAMVEATRDHFQIPADVPAAMGLSLLGMTQAKRTKIERRDGSWEEVLIWTLVGLGPGTLKTPTLQKLKAPFLEFIEQERLEQQPDFLKKKTEFKLLKDQMQQLLASLKRLDKDHREYQPTWDKLTALQLEESKGEPKQHKYFVDDATPEALAVFLAQNEGKAACISDEGTFLKNALGQYSKNPNLSIYLQAWSGGTLPTLRISRDELELLEAYLTIGVFFQPDGLKKIANDQDAAGTGFFARFLACLPNSAIGYRTIKDDAFPAAVEDDWRSLVKFLMSQHDSRWLRLSPEAKQLLLDLRKSYENDLRPNAPLSPIVEFVSKCIPGNLLRVAAVLHAATKNPSDVVGVEIIQAAHKIIDYYVDHALYLKSLGEDEPFTLARKLRDVLRTKHLKHFASSLITNEFKTTRKQTELIDYVYVILTRAGIIKPDKISNKDGRPRSYLVNPEVSKGKFGT